MYGISLFYGDNLLLLRNPKYFKEESVDLVYIDPPFNSNANYNVLFKEQDGTRAAGQIKAFTDTWQWDVAADKTYRDLLKRGDAVSQAVNAFYRLLGANDMFAYLVMMAPRLIELHRVLKPTGSFYLHCDPTASHYLKILLDSIYGPAHFRSEIIWKRTSAHSSAHRYGPIHDVLLFYTKSDEFTWNPQFTSYDDNYLRTFFDQMDGDGRVWKRTDLTGAGTRNGETGKVWRGRDVTAKGRHWMYPPRVLDQLDLQGRIHWPKKDDGMPRLKQYPEDLPGVPIQDVWTDIAPMHNLSAERLGYPTQKPLALLKRIIESSSNQGDIILDAFCGCGTAVDAAEDLHRHWIGIDITHTAINVIRQRLDAKYGPGTAPEPIGQPQTVEDAAAMAKDSPYAFEDWALSLVGADQPAKKKGADKGIDGRRVFAFAVDGTPLEALFSVKSGTTRSPHVRDLRGTIEREKAAMGVLITLQKPTKDMRDEALAAGPCEIPGYAEDCPRMQILTIAELLEGKQPQFPTLLAAAIPPPKQRPTAPATVTSFQRPLPGAALVEVSKKTDTTTKLPVRSVGGRSKRTAGD